MAAITPIVASLNTDTTNSTTTEADALLKTSALDNGVKYLVIWSAQVGGSDNAAVVEATLRFGTSADVTTGTTLSYVGGEGAESTGGIASGGGHRIQGFTVVTGDGSSILKFGFRCLTASDTAGFGAGFIVAIPLSLLTEGVDYFFDGTDSDSFELTNASTASMQTIRTKTWDLGASADWLVGICTEGHPGEGANNESCRVQFSVGGTRLGDAGAGDPFKSEWEDDADWFTFAWYRVLTLSGSTAFLAEGRSENAAESDYRRTRFFALRKSKLTQIVQLIDSTGVNANVASYTNFMTQAYTPLQTEYVLALASMIPKSQSFARTCQLRLRNSTDAADLVTDVSINENAAGVGDGNDQIPVTLVGCQQISGAKTYTVDYRRSGSNGSVAVGKSDDVATGINSVLILVGLTTLDAVSVEPDPAALSLSVPTPTVTRVREATPDPVELALSVPTPSVAPGAVAATPDPVSLALSVPQPTVDRNLDLSAGPVELSLSVPEPSVDRVLDMIPDAVALALALPAAAVTRGAVALEPDPVGLELEVPTPDIERQVARPIASAASTNATRGRDYQDATRDRDYTDTSRSN